MTMMSRSRSRRARRGASGRGVGAGLAALLDRRLVAPQALSRYLAKGPRTLTAAVACSAASARVREHLAGVRDGVDAFLNDGPVDHPQFAMLAADIRGLCATGARADGGPSPALRDSMDTRAGRAALCALMERR